MISENLYEPDRAGNAVVWDFDGMPEIDAERVGKPFGWYMCIQPVKIKSGTALVLPENMIERYEGDVMLCRVVALGKLAYKHREFQGLGEEDSPSVGGLVIVRKHCGQDFPLKSKDGRIVDCRIIADKEILYLVNDHSMVGCLS